MPTVNLSPVGGAAAQFFDNNGVILSSGKIYTYAAGTTTPQTTYTSSSGATAHTNPIILDSAGRVPSGEIWISNGVNYKFVLKTANDVLIGTYDNIPPGVSGTAADITYTPAGTGAVTTTVQAKLRESVSVTDFGAVGNGVADDTAAIQAALNSLGSAGGSVSIPNNMRCLIDGALTIPVNCLLVGPHQYVGSPGDNTSAPYGSMGGALIVNSAATITISSNASINGVLIYRKGMTFPTVNATAFAGTAITINGDDAAVSHCQILGFNKAIYSTGDQRQRINNIWFDCVNGIEITNCLDIPYINTCHGWPFATIAASNAGTPGASIIRTGTAYYLHDTVDWAKLTDCFSYGYFRGFDLTAVNSCTLLSCSADNTTSAGVPTHIGSIGFSIGGQENRLIGCQSAAQDSAGASIATINGITNTVIGFNAWACGDHGVLLTGGDLSISASNFRDMSYGITVNNTQSKVIDGGGNRFEGIVVKPYNFAAASDTSKVQITKILSDLPDGNSIISGTYTIPSIASVDPLNLPVNGSQFIVTGTISIGSLNGGYAGRVVTLMFSNILVISSSTGVVNAMRLSGNANYTSSANSTLTLMHNGTQWVEIGRSA